MYVHPDMINNEELASFVLIPNKSMIEKLS